MSLHHSDSKYCVHCGRGRAFKQDQSGEREECVCVDSTWFLVDLGNVSICALDVWPDGDGPEHPTAADVVEQMRKSGSVERVLSEWNLTGEITVTGNGTAAFR